MFNDITIIIFISFFSRFIDSSKPSLLNLFFLISFFCVFSEIKNYHGDSYQDFSALFLWLKKLNRFAARGRNKLQNKKNLHKITKKEVFCEKINLLNYQPPLNTLQIIKERI